MKTSDVRVFSREEGQQYYGFKPILEKKLGIEASPPVPAVEIKIYFEGVACLLYIQMWKSSIVQTYIQALQKYSI